jgi:hypothetical protein
VSAGRIQEFKNGAIRNSGREFVLLEFLSPRVLEFFLAPPQKGEEEGKKRQSVDASLTLRR